MMKLEFFNMLFGPKSLLTVSWKFWTSKIWNLY